MFVIFSVCGEEEEEDGGVHHRISVVHLSFLPFLVIFIYSSLSLSHCKQWFPRHFIFLISILPLLLNQSEAKWKQLADMATNKCEFRMAQECLHKAHDFGGLLLLASCSGDMDMVSKLADNAATSEKNNIAFMAFFLQGKWVRNEFWLSFCESLKYLNIYTESFTLSWAPLYVCFYVLIYVCFYVYMYVCICIGMYVHVFNYIQLCACFYVFNGCL